MADLGGRGGGFAALDAVEPVSVLVVALVEMHLVMRGSILTVWPAVAVGVVISSRVTKIQPLVPYHLMPLGKSPEMSMVMPLA